MAKAAAGLLLVALAGVEGKGSGTGLPTRTYGRPNKGSNAYKYAGAAGVGAVGGYWVGSHRYSPSYGGYHYSSYGDYRSHYSHSDHGWRNRYGSGGNRYRNTDCSPRTRYPQPEWTKAWTWAQIVLGVNRTAFNPVELETDLFRDLVWRSPCAVPTQVLISYVCSLPAKTRIPTSSMSQPNTCTYAGSVESVHSVARRQMLQTTSGYTVVELAVGLRHSAEYNDMLSAVRESFDDPYSSVAQTYKTTQASNVAGSSGTSVVYFEFAESAATARTLQALVMGSIFALVSLVL
eukprot:Hpha_TRINITY_DN16633_c0_g1::TRINITY_DN16633_c0_g1_i1::g.179449::m.179449